MHVTWMNFSQFIQLVHHSKSLRTSDLEGDVFECHYYIPCNVIVSSNDN